MVLVKIRPFFQHFFSALQVRKMTFSIFQIDKTPFQALKTRSSKSRKIYIFPKGLTHGFGPKNGHFSDFFFQAIKARKMSFTIFQNGKSLFQTIKTRTSKSRKIVIFPKVFVIFPFFPWFWPNNGHFCNFFFGNIEKENVFYGNLQRKNAFLGYKNKTLEK